MNLLDSHFLCLDIGSGAVRGIAHHVRGGKIAESESFTVESYDTVTALRSVIDELEHKIGAHFDAAYITGNFGPSQFKISQDTTIWPGEHKITPADVRAHITAIERPNGFYPMHIIPFRYATPTMRNIADAVGRVDRGLTSVFCSIFYDAERLNEIMSVLRHAHMQSKAFFDPQFLQSAPMRTPDGCAVMYIDFGAEFTSVSIWVPNGPILHEKIPIGGTQITRDISEKLNIDFYEAERIKRAAACMTPRDMDRFTPADAAYEFSRGDINDILLPHMVEIIGRIQSVSISTIEKRRPTKIIISGGASDIPDIDKFIENAFSIPVENIGANASVRALSDFIWLAEKPHRDAYIARQQRMRTRIGKIAHIFRRRKRKPQKRFIPIMPSTLCFDMNAPATYSLFAAGGISMIHVDIMDGLYVDRIAGGIAELERIRRQTRDHLHVHLMTQSPTVWAADAIAAGADTIILSTGTAGVRTALQNIRAAGRRCGVALNPESSVTLLKPILRDIDEVMIMAVNPGAAGQEFNTNVLKKIEILNNTRKKFNLKLTISVDGGINDQTAQLCWAAGADLLVSGSYLGRSSDFPLSVQKLLPQSK